MHVLENVGAINAEAEVAVVAIAEALAEWPLHAEARVGLTSAAASSALFFHQLARVTGDSIHAAHAERYASRVHHWPNRDAAGLSLYTGTAGLSWLMRRISPTTTSSDPQYLLDTIDRLNDQLCRAESEPVPFDLIQGLIGVGAALLDMLPSPKAVDGVCAILRWIACEDERDPELSWSTAPSILTIEQRSRTPKGRFDFGMAHGIPGVVAFLALACTRQVGGPLPRQLLCRMGSSLATRSFPGLPAGSFPAWLAAGANSSAPEARAAWCYGGPGVGFALLLAAQALGDARIRETAIEVLRSSLARPLETSGVLDASICHGSAGLAHIAMAASALTEDPVLTSRAAYWIAVTLRMRAVGSGVGGYRYFGGADAGWRDDPSFITGASGIGLVLLHWLDPDDRSWDRLLLMS